MQNILDLYFLEQPIDTPLGKCRFFKVKEFGDVITYSELLNLDKNTLLNKICGEVDDKTLDSMIDESYIDIIRKYDSILGLHIIFENLFQSLFDVSDIDKNIKIEINRLQQIIDDNNLNKDYKIVLQLQDIQKRIDYFKIYLGLSVFDRIQSDKELKEYSDLIKVMNCIKDKESEIVNEELDYFDKMARILKEQKGEVITFKSVCLNVGLYKDNILDISVYNLYAYFDAISNNKNYDTGTLFQTVSTKPMNVKPWYTDSSIKKTKLDEKDKARLEKGMSMVQEDHSKDGITTQI